MHSTLNYTNPTQTTHIRRVERKLLKGTKEAKAAMCTHVTHTASILWLSSEICYAYVYTNAHTRTQHSHIGSRTTLTAC